MILTFSPK